jgi:hypothetical protein
MATGLPVDPQRKRGGIEAVTARTSEKARPGSGRGLVARRRAKRGDAFFGCLSRFDLVASVPGIPLLLTAIPDIAKSDNLAGPGLPATRAVYAGHCFLATEFGLSPGGRIVTTILFQAREVLTSEGS